jgi:phosphoglycerol transferase MdoB-like AlkP superfamily enzyme
MILVKNLMIQLAKLLLFWVLIFDFQRLMFSIHNWDKFQDVSWGNWFMTFLYSLRLDLATAAFLCVLPLLFLMVRFLYPSKRTKTLFIGVVLVEALLCSLIHSGEINAYPEWNHKLTSRVFMHLSNPDEVFRTADYSMTIWFIVYVTLELLFAWRITQILFLRKELPELNQKLFVKIPIAVLLWGSTMIGLFIMARGGLQQIPININSAYFTNNHTANDLAVNSAYYFANSYLLYNRSEIDDLMPDIDRSESRKIVEDYYNYPKDHNVRILDNERPNVVFIILESWAAEAIGCLSETKGATPNFDALAKEGLLFTKMYSTSSTSEIGNSSIFSGNPGIPGISISLQPEKYRKLRSINEDFQDWGYSSHYIFSGDLKYGNIGGYFMDHGFQDVKDENDFPNSLGRGKLNYYDEDLYQILIDRINGTKEPFLHCAFTGSTHSPYDHPKKANQNWEGNLSDFMNSLIYADDCLKEFTEKCKEQDWFENTLFIFVADHGHTSPAAPDPFYNNHFRIPMLIWGKPLKKEFRGKTVDKVCSQSDIAATLMYQLGGDPSRYPWSKDMLNPNAPEFALHTIIRGYGWVTPKGGMTYQMDMKQYIDNTFPKEVEAEEIKKGHAYLTEIYEDYKNL